MVSLRLTSVTDFEGAELIGRKFLPIFLENKLFPFRIKLFLQKT